MKVCFITRIYPPVSLGELSEVVYNLQKFFLEHDSGTMFSHVVSTIKVILIQ